jgi:hypothetical protein
MVTCAYVTRSIDWWMGLGAIAGMIIGLGGIMAEYLSKEQDQIMAGFMSGVVMARRTPRAHLPIHKDIISSLSAVTLSLFAILVTSRFVINGLEAARTLSSRLSVSTTILITLLAMPSALGLLLTQRLQIRAD